MARIYSKNELNQLHNLSIHNKGDISKSKIAGCFYCLEKFDTNKIKNWIDSDDTALCPNCGIDSVIGDNTVYLTINLLDQMHSQWFK